MLRHSRAELVAALGRDDDDDLGVVVVGRARLRERGQANRTLALLWLLLHSGPSRFVSFAQSSCSVVCARARSSSESSGSVTTLSGA